MHFPGGSEKQFMFTEVHDSAAESLFALSRCNKTDASPIVSVVRKNKPRAVTTGEDSAIRDILNAKNFSMARWSEQAHGASALSVHTVANTNGAQAPHRLTLHLIPQ